MIEYQNIIPPLDYAKELAIKSQKTVMYIKAEGPSNCSDQQKLQEIWDFYRNVCDLNVLSMIMEYGECIVYFEGLNYARECLEDWFPRKKLLDNIEYDLDTDYYIYVDLFGPDGNSIGYN
jgi:hypothetical protein